MSFRILLSSASSKTLDALALPLRARLEKRIGEIGEAPFDHRYSKNLAHPPGYRSARVGDWRIVFVVDLGERLVKVRSIDRRGQVYKRL